MNSTTESIKLGKNLKRLRAAKGLTQADVAKVVGITCPYLSNVENGKVNPKLSTITKLARALDVPVEKLMRQL